MARKNISELPEFDLNDRQLDILLELWLCKDKYPSGIMIPELISELNSHDVTGIGEEYNTVSRILNQLIAKRCVEVEGSKRNYRFMAIIEPDDLVESMLKQIQRMLEVKSSLKDQLIIEVFKLLKNPDVNLPTNRALKKALFERLLNDLRDQTTSVDEDC